MLSNSLLPQLPEPCGSTHLLRIHPLRRQRTDRNTAERRRQHCPMDPREPPCIENCQTDASHARRHTSHECQRGKPLLPLSLFDGVEARGAADVVGGEDGGEVGEGGDGAAGYEERF